MPEKGRGGGSCSRWKTSEEIERAIINERTIFLTGKKRLREPQKNNPNSNPNCRQGMGFPPPIMGGRSKHTGGGKQRKNVSSRVDQTWETFGQKEHQECQKMSKHFLGRGGFKKNGGKKMARNFKIAKS